MKPQSSRTGCHYVVRDPSSAYDKCLCVPRLGESAYLTEMICYHVSRHHYICWQGSGLRNANPSSEHRYPCEEHADLPDIRCAEHQIVPWAPQQTPGWWCLRIRMRVLLWASGALHLVSLRWPVHRKPFGRVSRAWRQKPRTGCPSRACQLPLSTARRSSPFRSMTTSGPLAYLALSATYACYAQD